MRKYLRYGIGVAVLFFCGFGYANNNVPITDYHQVFIPCEDQQEHLQIAIRMYYQGTSPYFLLVNPYNFVTSVVPAAECAPRKREYQFSTATNSRYYTMRELQQTPYMQALNKFNSWPYKLQNDGIVHAEVPVMGVFLTADMCPSRKSFEKNFFQTLVARAAQTQQPTPIALSISGLWIIGHPKEFNWLVQQEKQNKLQITWINHTFSHLYYADLPLGSNFMLAKNTNIKHEILETEKLLLERQQLPSVFFRFPGLISNKKLILKLQEYGLIPIGADAWLAKGQKAKSGSIILVHGNSNEPEGIKLVMPLIQKPELNLLPLSQAFQASSSGKPPQ